MACFRGRGIGRLALFVLESVAMRSFGPCRGLWLRGEFSMRDGCSGIAANLLRIRARIGMAAARAGRDAGSVRLIGVTKAAGVEEARMLLDLGVVDLGENRIEHARGMVAALPGARWHMIGSCQRRKAGEVVALFSYVDSVDRIELAEALGRRCDEQDRTLRVLLEVNVSGEDAKHGFEPREVGGALDAIRAIDRLAVDGLMTMAPLADDPEEARPVFAGLRRLAEDCGLRELSMGMSNDFEVAVEEGATQIRIGTLLFA